MVCSNGLTTEIPGFDVARDGQMRPLTVLTRSLSSFVWQWCCTAGAGYGDTSDKSVAGELQKSFPAALLALFIFICSLTWSSQNWQNNSEREKVLTTQTGKHSSGNFGNKIKSNTFAFPLYFWIYILLKLSKVKLSKVKSSRPSKSKRKAIVVVRLQK